MARTSKARPGSKGEKDPEALLVDDPRPLLERCRIVLAEVLPSAGKMNFQRQDYARDEREYLLVSDLYSRGKARSSYPVLPLLTTKYFVFWLAVGFRFGPFRGGLQLKHVSILIFEGSAADPDKIPLVRAEWDEADPAGPHAQPHWHVYPSPSPSPLTKPRPASFEEALEEAAGEPTGRTLEGERFHYAMSAVWHLDGGGHQSRLSKDGLLRWLPGCVLYTRNQLVYLSGG